MTTELYAHDPYRKSAPGTVTALTEEGGVILDQSLFYPRGGGQPGDSGRLRWSGGALDVATTIRDDDNQIVLVPAEPAALPPVGGVLEQGLDWERRYGYMRVHTALHLLSVVVPFPVTGGAISAERGRLDFAMPEGIEDKAMLEGQLNALVTGDLVVSESWIEEAELDANPGLVKTMSVAPPRGRGRIRLVRIGSETHTIDLQPCGGTHVARTSEIGPLRIGKVEKKGRQNRRISIHLDD